jgi:hypothetical protein
LRFDSLLCVGTEAAIGSIDSNGGILFGARGVLTASGEYYQRCAASGECFN